MVELDSKAPHTGSSADADQGINAANHEQQLAASPAVARAAAALNPKQMMPSPTGDRGAVLTGLLPIAAKLVSRGEFDDADTILRAVMANMPDCYQAFEAYAMSAWFRQNWAEMLARWTDVSARFPDRPIAVSWLATAYQINRRYDEAERILIDGLERFPNEPVIARDFARLSMAQGNHEEALRRLSGFRVRFPSHVDGYAGAAEALRMLGRFEDAESILESVRDRFKNDFHFNSQSAWNAVRLGRWSEAFRRWDVMLGLFPDAKGVAVAIGDSITLWQLAKAEGDPLALSAHLPEAIARKAGLSAAANSPATSARLSDRDVMMRFEGLGDRCEFGLVQRQFGVEPLGLLRWSGISPRSLINMLESQLDGVGDPANTFVELRSDTQEYFAGDNRYFYMHTFIKANEIEKELVFEKFRKRLVYLKRKLLEDLASGEKVFLYKISDGALTDDEALEISRIFRKSYPACRVMLMRVSADPTHIGTVVPIAENAVWGYLSSFYETTGGVSRFDEWRAVCRACLQHFGKEDML